MRNPYLTLYDKYDASKKIPLQVAFKTICFIDYLCPPGNRRRGCLSNAQMCQYGLLNVYPLEPYGAIRADHDPYRTLFFLLLNFARKRSSLIKRVLSLPKGGLDCHF